MGKDKPQMFTQCKVNLWFVVAALLALGWMSKGLYQGALEVIPQVLGQPEAVAAAAGGEGGQQQGATLAGDIAKGDVQGALIQLLLHIIGGQLLLPIIAGLVAMGVKLLDEKPDAAPATVPAATHEKALDREERMSKLEDGLARLERAITKAEGG